MIDNVLLVDASPWVAPMLKAMLQRAGCRVSHATSVGQARLMLESRRPDLLVVDERLPDGSGHDIAQAAHEIYAQAPNPNDDRVPIIILVSHGLREDRATAVGYPHTPNAVLLHKPVQIESFETLVRACLASSRTLQADRRARDRHAPTRESVVAPAPKEVPPPMFTPSMAAHSGLYADDSSAEDVPWIDGHWGDAPPLPNRAHPDAPRP